MRSYFYRICILCVAFFSLTATSYAEDVKIRVLGWHGSQPLSQHLERPFWQNLGTTTDGRFSASFRTIDELGLKGFESLRTLQSGAFDILSFQVSFVGGEAPVLMGVDLPGATFTFDQLKENIQAYRPVLENELDTRFDAKLLTAWSFPFQILYCKGQQETLDGLKGKKVRVSGALSAKLIEELGGVGVTIGGPEVYQALMLGVVDCAITGSQYGNSNDWYQVSDTLNTTPLGGAGVIVHVARNDFWNKLTDEQKSELSEQMSSLEADLWAMSQDNHLNGINCNTNSEPCDGRKGAMSLVETTEADRNEVAKILHESIVPLWLEDCEKISKTCGDDWYNTIGTLLDIKK